MIEKPDFILHFQKPENTEIKHIRGHWYLYERHNKYDPSIKRSRKVSGKCLGRITEQGLIPTKRRLVSVDHKPQISDVVEVADTRSFSTKEPLSAENAYRSISPIYGNRFMSSALSVPCITLVSEDCPCTMKTVSLRICYPI